MKGKDWFLRAYTTQENSGDSYTATTAAVAVNSSWKSNQTGLHNTQELILVANLQGATDAQAHAAARAAAETGRLFPGTLASTGRLILRSIQISKTGEQSLQINQVCIIMKDNGISVSILKLLKYWLVETSADYHLDSKGTIFADTAGTIKINEYGAIFNCKKDC